MKKYIAVLIAAMMLVCGLTGCGGSDSESGKTAKSGKTEKIQIVTTIFPEYDWVKEILGENADNAEITMLIDNSVDMHSYQPTAEDVLKISGCDLFIYVGGESDEWVEDALKEAENKDLRAINLLDVLGQDVKEEEVVEGMEAEEESEAGTDDSGDAQEDEPEYDEHVWLSLKNAQVLCSAIKDSLKEIDADHADEYEANAQAYNEKLSALDQKYQETAETSEQKTLLFGDRFPFRYLADDYGLTYYAAFTGCSAETEASFKTITFLAEKVDELGLKHVMTIEKSDGKIAKTIIENTKEKNQDVLVLDSMQATDSDDIAGGTTYLSVMEKNLEVLKEALE